MPTYNNDKEHFKHVLEHLFIPAIKGAGLAPISPVAAGSPVIHSEIIKQIADSDVVLCDMSSHNANVFFELGIRTALNRPVCLVQDAFVGKSPFDLSLVRHHTYDASLAPWMLDDEIEALQSHIKAVVSSGEGNAMWQVVGLKKMAEEAIDPLDPVAARLALLENQVRILINMSGEAQLNMSGEAQLPSRVRGPLRTIIGRRILWVDDAPDNNSYEQSQLEAEGAEVVIATSTKEAMEALQAQKFDLVLSDVARIESGRDNPTAGFNLLQRIREELGLTIPVIFYTSNAAKTLNNSVVRLHRSAAADRPDELIRLVRSELSGG